MTYLNSASPCPQQYATQYATQYRGTPASTALPSFANTGKTYPGSERDFKRELRTLIEDRGFPANQRVAIANYLDQDIDQRIGTKLRAMMSMKPPLLPPDMAPRIAEIASKHGVPNSSVDKQKLFEPISATEARASLGIGLDLFTNGLGMPLFREQEAAESESEFDSQMFDPRWLPA